MHKSQIFFWFLVSFLSGVFVASVFSVSQTVIYLGFISSVGLIGIFGYNRSFNSKLLLAGFFGVAFLFGIARLNSANFDKDRLDAFTDLKAGNKGIEVTVNGYIDDEPVDRGGRQEIILRAKELVAGDRTVPLDDIILLTVNNFPKFNYGDAVSVRGDLRKPENLTGFDYVTYLKKEGIRTTMFYPDISGSDKYGDTLIYKSMSFFEKTKIDFYRKIFSIKAKFESAVGRSVPEPNAAFINGILLGSRQDIPDAIEEAFNETGATHILAISGYNIMIISWAVLAGLVYFFRRRIAFWLSVVIIVLFVILTGASESVVRAAIMGLLLLFANGYGRLYNPKNSIIFAGAAMAYFNPFVLVFDIGFQLSFAAVLGLMYLYPRVDNKLKKIPKFGNLKEIFLMTLSAQIAVAPLLIYYFRNFSLVSLPVNLMILPFIPAAMFAGFISGLTGMIFPPLGQVIGWFAWAITAYQIEVVELFAGMF
ncbi:MAG: ComEC/Rec2 family competence protein [Patescibacteria group bacterium]